MNYSENLAYLFMRDHPEDAARVLEQIEPDSAAALLKVVPVEVALPILRRMSPFTGAHCLRQLNDTELLVLLRKIDTPTGISFIRYFKSDRRTRLLKQLPAKLTKIYEKLLSYPGETIGAWMNPAPVILTAEMTCEHALEQICGSDEPSIIYIFVIGKSQRVIGYLETADLLRSEPDIPLGKLVRPAVYSLQAQAELVTQLEHMGWQEMTILPVLNHSDRLVGTISYSALRRALLTDKTVVQVVQSTEGMFTGVASSYWFGVSSLMHSLISLIPNDRQERKEL